MDSCIQISTGLIWMLHIHLQAFISILLQKFYFATVSKNAIARVFSPCHVQNRTEFANLILSKNYILFLI